VSATTEIVDLGPKAAVAQLFSHPPNCHEICFLPQSLEETIALYIRSSLARDLYTDSTVVVRAEGKRVLAEISGEAAAPYAAMLGPFLAAGAQALGASQDVHKNKKWRYNWRFLLPLGLSMARHRSVQLLHFPPDYVLTRDQDYLSASTTMRWAELLIVNGVPARDVPLYQNIIDIAPIAAPSDDGKNLDGVYIYYAEYVVALLKLWLPTPDSVTKPMVAFGSPVRDWLKSHYHAKMKVLSLETIAITPELRVPTLAANHPSFIYNAVSRLKDDPNTPADERMPVLMRIMQEDLVAANWQAVMGETPSANPQTTLDACTKKWSSAAKQQQIQELVRSQVLGETPQQPAKLAPHFPVPPGTKLWLEHEPVRQRAIDDKVEALRRELGALDGREPHDIVDVDMG
jgi:hypothetical protein